MKARTEYSKTSKGTDNDEAPLTSSPTIGANSTSMMRSFTDTWTNV